MPRLSCSLSVLFWFLGHNAAWHVFRVDRVWRVIIPTGLVLITNQFYYQGDHSLDIYLIAFVIVSLLLLIRSHIDNREYDWFVHRVSFPTYVRRAFFQAGGVLALVLVLAAWIAPSGSDDKSLERVKNFLSGDAFVETGRLCGTGCFRRWKPKGSPPPTITAATNCSLSGAIQLGDQPVMIVEAPYGPRYYWRSTVYDAYDFSSWRWKHIRTVRAYTDESGLQFNIGATLTGARHEVEQTFTMLLRASDLVYAAPQPVEIGLPVEAELDCVNDFGRGCVNNNEPSDVAVIQARKTLRTGDSYTVTSSISTAIGVDAAQRRTGLPGVGAAPVFAGCDDVSPARARSGRADRCPGGRTNALRQGQGHRTLAAHLYSVQRVDPCAAARQ